MSAEQLNIRSITGVDVELEIAGPGSRSYAFIADWHIRVIVAFAWFIIALFVNAGTWALTKNTLSNLKGVGLGTAIAPALAIYFLYHPVLEILMNGRTPGKRMAAVRIVTTGGDTPGVGAIVIRNVFRLIDSLPMFYIVGLVMAVITKQHVRIGDMAAGTLLVMERGDTGVLTRIAGAVDNKRLSVEAAELADEILQRWEALAGNVRRGLAISFLRRSDPGFAAQQSANLTDGELKQRIQSLLSDEPS